MGPGLYLALAAFITLLHLTVCDNLSKFGPSVLTLVTTVTAGTLFVDIHTFIWWTHVWQQTPAFQLPLSLTVLLKIEQNINRIIC